MATTIDENYYTGVRTFEWLSDIVGLPVDQGWRFRRSPQGSVGVSGVFTEHQKPQLSLDYQHQIFDDGKRNLNAYGGVQTPDMRHFTPHAGVNYEWNPSKDTFLRANGGLQQGPRGGLTPNFGATFGMRFRRDAGELELQEDEPQMNFVLSQFTALILAGLLRIYLKPEVVTPAARHAYGLIGGLALGSFCFGQQAVHLAGLPALCYIVMRTQNPKVMQRVVLAVALAYLSCVHFYRQTYAYGSYTLDITGPLMVITQKVISLAYSIHDGITRVEKDLTPLQRHQAVRIMPTALEYFSYVFHFQGLMAGPVIFYRDYIDFIHANRFKGSTSYLGFYGDWSNKIEKIVVEPCPRKAVIKKVIASLTCAVIFVTFMPQYSVQRVKESDFLVNTSLPYKIWYLMISTMVVRFKYYYAWLFADAICNNSGMGYNGVDEDGNSRWDLISNVDIIGFELSLSLRESIEAWNKGTNRWLRMVAYERGGRYQLILTYGLSALWHGFYPGYYLTFASAALATFAARSVRRNIRPLFLHFKSSKFFYDMLTFTTTRICMACFTFSFVLLEFIPSVKLYFAMYLIPHLLALAAIFILPLLPLSRLNRRALAKIPDEKPSTSQAVNAESARASGNDQYESNNKQEVPNGQAKKVE